MALLRDRERTFVETVAEMAFCNPFLPERMELEQKALGKRYTNVGNVWSNRIDNSVGDENVEKLNAEVATMAERLRSRLAEGEALSGPERTIYIDFIIYHLFSSYYERFQSLVNQTLNTSGNPKVKFWDDFRADCERFIKVLPGPIPKWLDIRHLFAGFFQVRRAFYHIFNCIIGGSLPTAKLRAATWQSIFTHNMRRYQRCLYQSMGDLNVLITGPSGTGKDLVAKAIGMSRYVPFDPGSCTFEENFAQSYHTLSISALSPTLVESELFGHCKGAFTGALQDRTGYLELCSPLGTIFLDEIGEIDPSIQVKLLHVFQSRKFQALGDTSTRTFHGKIIAATNRDLLQEIEEGRFRQDFYYRLCSDVIKTPALAEQLADEPQELHNLIYLLVARLMCAEECYEVTQEVAEAIERDLGSDYPWPGNVRELEQCVRNIIVRKQYKPRIKKKARTLLDAMDDGELTADELVSYYCTVLYSKLENYQEVARRLNLDRRTVKAKIDHRLRERFEGE